MRTLLPAAVVVAASIFIFLELTGAEDTPTAGSQYSIARTPSVAATVPTFPASPSPQDAEPASRLVAPALASDGSHATPRPTDHSLDRIRWQSGEWYLHGANLPWYNWRCDFGCGSDGGVLETAAVIGERMVGDFNVVRWWVFPGDPWQLGDIPATYADFDRALQLADEHDVYFSFTLFSEPLEVDLGRPEVVVDALIPLLDRYGDHPRILSWEVFNEPEWAIWNGQASEGQAVEFARLVVEAVHTHTASYATIGSATLDGIAMWRSVDLDYYQPHWYDHMDSGLWCAICTDAQGVARRYDVERPIVIGEFYLGSDIDPLARLNDFYRRGYAGAWAWSLFPARTLDGMSIDATAMAQFSSAHEDIGPGD